MDCRDMIVSEDFMSVILDFSLFPSPEETSSSGYCFQKVNDSIGVLYFDRRGLPPLSVTDYMYRYVPQLYGLEGFPAAGGREFDSQPLEASGILAQQRGPLELTGRGVVFAVIDTGISYENPVFRYSDGSSRILAIWDQTDQSGDTPEGFAYGTEYTQEMINEALNSSDPYQIVPQRDEIGHGTALASVAAGSRLGGGAEFTGAAPDSLIVAVKVRQAKQYLRDYYMTAADTPAFSTDDLLFAVRYVQQFSVSFSRPVVILLGMGTSLGSHNGGSIMADYLQTVVSEISKSAVVSGGNQGNTAGHFRAGLMREAQRVELRAGENTRGFFAELWGARPAQFAVSIRSPGGETIPEVDFRLGNGIDYTFVYERTRITMNYVRMEGNTGDELILMRFENPTPGVWTINVRGVRTTADAVFDIWLTPKELLDGEAYFLAPTPEITLTMPSYTADAVTVTAYDSRSGSFYFNSSQGFSRIGAIKPDLAAPGVSVSTVNGPYSGTAVAAAITAGAAAQLMQWCVVDGNAVFVTGRSILAYLSSGARENPEDDYPSRQWGYGRLDMRKTFDEIAGRNRQ